MNDRSPWETPIILGLSLLAIIVAGWTIGFTGWLLGQIISGGGMP